MVDHNRKQQITGNTEPGGIDIVELIKITGDSLGKPAGLLTRER